MRWLWIDKFLEFRSGEFAKAVKNVSMAEDYLREHFPGYPVMPNSLIIEGMAQTGGLLVSEAKDYKNLVVLAKLSRVDFTDSALPGDQLTYEAKLVELRDEGAVVESKAFVNGRPLASAEIVFGHVERSRASEVLNGRYASYRQEMTRLLGVPDRSPKGELSAAPGTSPTGARDVS